MDDSVHDEIILVRKFELDYQLGHNSNTKNLVKCRVRYDNKD